MTRLFKIVYLCSFIDIYILIFVLLVTKIIQGKSCFNPLGDHLVNKLYWKRDGLCKKICSGVIHTIYNHIVSHNRGSRRNFITGLCFLHRRLKSRKRRFHDVERGSKNWNCEPGIYTVLECCSNNIHSMCKALGSVPNNTQTHIHTHTNRSYYLPQ